MLTCVTVIIPNGVRASMICEAVDGILAHDFPKNRCLILMM